MLYKMFMLCAVVTVALLVIEELNDPAHRRRW